MPDDARWRDLRSAAETLEPGAELETPVSKRRFRIGATFEDRIVVRFADSGEERALRREQFDVLVDRLAEEPIDVDSLAPGVEPYAVVLTLADAYGVADGAITAGDEGAEAGDSPYVVPAAEARTDPERVRDDARLLAAELDRHDATDFDAFETEALTDCYVLLSDVQRGADRLRRSARGPLLERLGPDQTLRGRYGGVRHTTRERRTPKDEATVLDALDDHGIPREWVLGIDPDKLDVVLAVTDLDESEVYDVSEQVYVQKTQVDEDEKYSRLQGLSDRVDELEGDEGERLRADLDEIEDRLEDALSSE